MRLFYAAIFTEKQLNTLKEIQARLHPLVLKGRFIEMEYFHITLNFLGEIPVEKIREYGRELDRAAKNLKPENLNFTSFGTFRKKGEHLIYLKADSHDSREWGLQTVTRKLKESIGEGDLRPIVPHITMVRRGILTAGNLQKLKEIRLETPPIAIGSLALLESVRIRGKLIYIPVHEVRLG
ncbi:MAG: RNA 2',3'-cyclic phosphodiesterase [Spirochaetales bacterium]|nr:RNA 2',3'-cyclic phosphodiesterase [Spirochaetales bacterium]